MTGIPFRAFISAGKWGFITCFVVVVLLSLPDNGSASKVGVYGRNEFEVWWFGFQLYLVITLVLFAIATIYASGVWIITLLFFRKPLTIAYVRNITLLCLVTTFGVFMWDGGSGRYSRVMTVTDVFNIIVASLWTALLGNRFAVTYLRMQQKRKNETA